MLFRNTQKTNCDKKHQFDNFFEKLKLFYNSVNLYGLYNGTFASEFANLRKPYLSEACAKATQKQTFSGASTSAVHCCLLLWE